MPFQPQGAMQPTPTPRPGGAGRPGGPTPSQQGSWFPPGGGISIYAPGTDPFRPGGPGLSTPQRPNNPSQVAEVDYDPGPPPTYPPVYTVPPAPPLGGPFSLQPPGGVSRDVMGGWSGGMPPGPGGQQQGGGGMFTGQPYQTSPNPQQQQPPASQQPQPGPGQPYQTFPNPPPQPGGGNAFPSPPGTAPLPPPTTASGPMDPGLNQGAGGFPLIPEYQVPSQGPLDIPMPGSLQPGSDAVTPGAGMGNQPLPGSGALQPAPPRPEPGTGLGLDALPGIDRSLNWPPGGRTATPGGQYPPGGGIVGPTAASMIDPNQTYQGGGQQQQQPGGQQQPQPQPGWTGRELGEGVYRGYQPRGAWDVNPATGQFEIRPESGWPQQQPGGGQQLPQPGGGLTQPFPSSPSGPWNNAPPVQYPPTPGMGQPQGGPARRMIDGNGGPLPSGVFR